MLVVVSWYADGSGQPQVNFQKVRLEDRRGLFGLGDLVNTVRNTEGKECRVWEVWGDDFHLLYDSTDKEKP